jgi:hypothetical protein
MAYKNTLKKYEQLKTARLEIVARMYKRGYSYADIQREVRAQLGMDKGYSLRTVHKDVHTLLNEWRDMRVEDVDDAIQVELARLKELEKEAWQEWDKSKQDYEKKRAKQHRVPVITGEGDEGSKKNEIVKMEQQREEVICYGDPRYLDIVHKCGIERRKILGLYAPEKKDISGEMSFANFLMETGVVNEQSEE